MDQSTTNAFQGASPFGYGFGGGGYHDRHHGTDHSALLLAASLLGRRRDDDSCHRHDCSEKIGQIIADNVSDIRQQIPDVKADVSKHIQMSMLQENNNSRNTDQLIFGSDKAMLEGFGRLFTEIVENRFRTKETEANMLRALDCETDSIKEKMSDFERSVDHQFCAVKGDIKDSERRILDRLSLDKLDEKNDEIARLRAKCDQGQNNLFLANELNGIKSLINSVEQTQRFNSKVVQFGAGNLAGTAQTANQG